MAAAVVVVVLEVTTALLYLRINTITAEAIDREQTIERHTQQTEAD